MKTSALTVETLRQPSNISRMGSWVVLLVLDRLVLEVVETLVMLLVIEVVEVTVKVVVVVVV